MLIIRDERAADRPAIHHLLTQAFDSDIEATIVDRLRAACEDRVSLVAADGEHVVGHILFTPVTISSDRGELRGYGLAPMAVAPAVQRTGIGSALIRAGLERLADSCPFVIVIGHPEYYPRFGFVPASRYGVRCQWEQVPEEAFMIRLLDPSIVPSGLAKYREEFDIEVR